MISKLEGNENKRIVNESANQNVAKLPKQHQILLSDNLYLLLATFCIHSAALGDAK